MNADDFRAKFINPKGICSDCKILPKVGRKARCYWCQLRKGGTDVEVQASYDRKSTPQASDYPEVPDGRYCEDCLNWVPAFYMKTRKRCRGCDLALSRSRRDEKTYGASPGTRQKLHELQGGRCAGCGNRQKYTGLAIHHNHDTQEIQGLLCKRCNHDGLGSLHDDPYILLRLLMVLTNPPARRILDPERVLTHEQHVEVITRMMEEINDEPQALAAREYRDPVAPEE